MWSINRGYAASYVPQLKLNTGDYELLKLNDGLLQVAVHPDELKYLLDDIGPVPEEGIDLVFSMGPVGTYGLQGVKQIESIAGLDHYMLGYVTGAYSLPAISIPPAKE